MSDDIRAKNEYPSPYGLKLIAKTPDGAAIVSMVLFDDQLIVATGNGIYRLSNETLIPIPLNEVES